MVLDVPCAPSAEKSAYRKSYRFRGRKTITALQGLFRRGAGREDGPSRRRSPSLLSLDQRLGLAEKRLGVLIVRPCGLLHDVSQADERDLGVFLWGRLPTCLDKLLPRHGQKRQRRRMLRIALAQRRQGVLILLLLETAEPILGIDGAIRSSIE